MEPQADIRAAKAALRSAVLARRAGLGAPARAAASARVRARLGALPELAGARAILGFAAFGSEVDLDPFLRACIARGLGVFLPWVDGAELGVARVRDLGADLVPGWRGVREPRAIGRLAARSDRLDAVIVPGVAFDRRARRLGYGGGHFDRLLGRLPPGVPAIGVAFDAQVVDAVPVEGHDRPLDVVVTESAEFRPPRPAPAGRG